MDKSQSKHRKITLNKALLLIANSPFALSINGFCIRCSSVTSTFIQENEFIASVWKTIIFIIT